MRGETYPTARPRRGSGTCPAGGRVEPRLTVTTQVAEAALATALRRLGGRVSATNQPARQGSLTQAVGASRAASLVEPGFGRLQGKPLALTPL